jgi:molybdopterin biosynthesis enzyme MoaB
MNSKPNPFQVLSVNISEQKHTPKRPAKEINIIKIGIVGDAHAGNSNKQVSLLTNRAIETFSRSSKRAFKAGELGENITISDLDISQIELLDKIVMGKKSTEATLEVTQKGKPYDRDTHHLFREQGESPMHTEGIFLRVLQGGSVAPEDPALHIRRSLKIFVLTLVDKNKTHEKIELGQAQASNLLMEYFSSRNWDSEVMSAIVPKVDTHLRTALEKAKDNIDIVITIGGTGIQMDDIVPDVVSQMCDKTTPALMNHILAKVSKTTPMQLVNRPVAGVMNKTLVYSIPEGQEIVESFVRELLQVLEQSVLAIKL